MDIVQKKTYDKFPVDVHFSHNLVANETVSSAIVTCINTETGVDSSSEIIHSTSTVGTMTVRVVIKAGINGDKHKITVKATTNLLNIYEKEFIVEIIDTVDNVFAKQPSEIFIIAADFTNMPITDTLATWSVTATKTSDGTASTGTVILADGLDGLKILIGIQAGTDGDEHLIATKVVTTLGYQFQIDALMKIVEA